MSTKPRKLVGSKRYIVSLDRTFSTRGEAEKARKALQKIFDGEVSLPFYVSCISVKEDESIILK